MMVILIFLQLFFSQSNDIYYVSHINGKVMSSKTRQALKIGDQLKLDDALIFNSDEDLVALISPQKGRYTLRRKKSLNASRLPGILVKLSENLIPTNLTQTLAGRGVINSKNDLKFFFKNLARKQGDTIPRLTLLDTLSFSLSKSAFKDLTKQFFFIRYTLNGEVINKKLSFDIAGNTSGEIALVIDKNLFLVDGKPIDQANTSALGLYYYDAVQKQSELISALKISSYPPEQLIQEVKVLKSNLNLLYASSPNRVKIVEDIILDELSVYYGYLNQQEILEFILHP